MKDFRKEMAKEIQRLHANNQLSLIASHIAREIQGLKVIQEELKERVKELEEEE